MDSSYAIRTSEPSPEPYVINEPSKWKTLGIAIVIIVGIGGLVAAGVGLGGYLHTGSLSHLRQVNSIKGAIGGLVITHPAFKLGDKHACKIWDYR